MLPLSPLPPRPALPPPSHRAPLLELAKESLIEITQAEAPGEIFTPARRDALAAEDRQRAAELSEALLLPYGVDTSLALWASPSSTR